MKIIEIIAENRVEFVEKCNIIKIWLGISIGHLKYATFLQNFAFGPKPKEDLQNLKTILIFFDQTSMENWVFSHFY